MRLLRTLGFVLICISISSCSSRARREACTFTDPPTEELLRGRLQHLELVDAETGEVASYDPQGNPVLEGGQPLALWAEFDPATAVGVCVLEIDKPGRAVYQSEVTFTREVNTLPLGIYDLGAYRIYLSVGGTLAMTLDFTVR